MECASGNLQGRLSLKITFCAPARGAIAEPFAQDAATALATGAATFLPASQVRDCFIREDF